MGQHVFLCFRPQFSWRARSWYRTRRETLIPWSPGNLMETPWKWWVFLSAVCAMKMVSFSVSCAYHENGEFFCQLCPCHENGELGKTWLWWVIDTQWLWWADMNSLCGEFSEYAMTVVWLVPQWLWWIWWKHHQFSFRVVDSWNSPPPEGDNAPPCRLWRSGWTLLGKTGIALLCFALPNSDLSVES